MSIDNNLTKTFGDGVIVDSDKIHDDTYGLVHISPKMDLLLGGGLSPGLTTVAGPPKGGKTIFSLYAAGKAQAVNRPTFYISVEGRDKKRDFDGIQCLDPQKLKVVRSFKNSETNEGRILSAEEFLSITEKIAHSTPHALIIIDSLSQLVSAAELDKDFGVRDRASAAILLSQFFRRISNVIRVNDIILIGIQHVITNVSGYGKKFLISGGLKALYNSDTALEIKSVKLITNNKDDSEESGPAVGQEVTWQLNWSANSAPGRSITSTITFGKGIDENIELVQMGIDTAFIKKSGAWYTLDFIGENPPKLQGEKRVVEFFEQSENLPHKEKLEKLINEMIYSN